MITFHLNSYYRTLWYRDCIVTITTPISGCQSLFHSSGLEAKSAPHRESAPNRRLLLLASNSFGPQ